MLISIGSQSLRMEEPDESEDPFTSKMMSFDQQGGGQFQPLLIGRSTLKRMPRTEVFVREWPAPLKYQYFRSLIPDVAITMCRTCWRVCFSTFYLTFFLSLVFPENRLVPGMFYTLTFHVFPQSSFPRSQLPSIIVRLLFVNSSYLPDSFFGSYV